MHANLVRATGVYATTHERRQGSEFFLHHPIGFGGTPAFARRHPVAMDGVTADGAVHGTAVFFRHAGHQGQIFLFEGARGELIGQGAVRGVVFGHNEQPGGFLVETVHDARTLHPADPAQAARAMRQQSVHHRVVARAHARMHHHTRRLVEHDQVLVLKNHFERYIHRLELGDFHLGKTELQCLAALYIHGLTDHLAIELDQPRLQRPLECHPAMFGKGPRQHLVYAFAAATLGNYVGTCLHVIQMVQGKQSPASRLLH